MIISWFTDPSQGTFDASVEKPKYSSFYQYDTESNHFTRIRLELGREASSASDDEYSGGAKEMYSETRYISFSSEELEDGKWSVKDGKLMYNGKEMRAKPLLNDYVYDTSRSTGKIKPHYGNPVTDSPNLPEGIEFKHLSLLANDSFINKKTVKLTKREATADELSEALKTEIGKVMGKNFDEITDKDLLAKLQSQVSKIKNTSCEDLTTKLSESIESVKTSLEKMAKDIEEAGITPDEKFETATENAFSSLREAQDLVKNENIKKAINHLNEAKTSLEMADATTEIPSIVQSLSGPSEALKDAMKASSDWTAMQQEYEALENSDSIKSYESEIGVDSNIEEPVTDEPVAV